MIQDLRLAFRSLLNTPGLSCVAIITVALAIALRATRADSMIALGHGA